MGSSAITELVERSKESSDLQDESREPLEYSNSMNQIEPGEPSIGQRPTPPLDSGNKMQAKSFLEKTP